MYGFAALRTINGALTVGDIIAFVMYFSRVRTGISTVAGGIGGMSVDLEFMKTASDFLDIPDEKYKGTIPTLSSTLCMTLILNGGSEKKMALVGKNGCGKSTLVKLLCRLYDPTEGEITLNGIDIRKYKYEDYMELFSVVFQDSELFSFSIAENVTATSEYAPEEVEYCVRRAVLGTVSTVWKRVLEPVCIKILTNLALRYREVKRRSFTLQE